MTEMSDRIRRRRRELGLTQQDVAAACNVSRANVAHWEKVGSTRPNGQNLSSLAKVLQCHVDYLLRGVPLNSPPADTIANVEKQADTLRFLPLFLDEAIPVNSAGELNLEKAIKMVPTTAEVGQHGFAAMVRGDSMVNPHGFPSMPDGSRVIVDPDRAPASGNFVYAQVAPGQRLVVKKYIEDGPHRFLVSLNQSYPMISCTTTTRILGVVVSVEQALIADAFTI